MDVARLWLSLQGNTPDNRFLTFGECKGVFFIMLWQIRISTYGATAPEETSHSVNGKTSSRRAPPPLLMNTIPIYHIPALSFPTTGALVPCELSSGVQPRVLVSWLKTLEFHLVFGEKPADALIGSGRYLCEALMFSSDLNIGASHGDKKKPYFAPVS